MNAYDALCILPVALKDEEQQEALDRVKDEIEKLGGSVDKMEILGKRTFARPMKKADAGVYARMLFGLDPAAVDRLLARLKLNDAVFRVQIKRASEKKAEEPEAAEAGAAEKEGESNGGS